MLAQEFIPGRQQGARAMAVNDKQSAPITRRDFLVTGLSFTGTLAGAGLMAPIIRYPFPTVRGNAAARVRVASTSQPTPLGAVVDFEYETPRVRCCSPKTGPTKPSLGSARISGASSSGSLTTPVFSALGM